MVIFESTRPDNPTTGGSYISLRVIVKGLAEAGRHITIVSYVSNPLIQFPDLDNVHNQIIPHYSLRRLLGKKVTNLYNIKERSIINRSKNKPIPALRKLISNFFTYFF